MKDEIFVATRWIVENVGREDLSFEILCEFESNIQTMLEERFKGHWHEREPWRGQAFRSLMVDEHSIDSLIENAAEKSGILDVHNRVRGRRWMLWIDPGEVEVKDEVTNHRTLLFRRELVQSAKHKSAVLAPFIVNSPPVNNNANSPSYWISSAPPPSVRSGRVSPPKSLNYNVNSKQFVPTSNMFINNSGGINYSGYPPPQQHKTILRRPTPTRSPVSSPFMIGDVSEGDQIEYPVYRVPSPREMSVSSQA